MHLFHPKVLRRRTLTRTRPVQRSSRGDEGFAEPAITTKGDIEKGEFL